MVRPALREYESAVAASPTRHAILNRPFNVLRRRTETLLDQITGANNVQEVKADQRQMRERDRANRCRSCRMIFADEVALSRHYNLFPQHTAAPERKAKPAPRHQHTSRSGAGSSGSQERRRRKRTQSTPGFIEEHAAAASSAGHGQEITEAGPSMLIHQGDMGLVRHEAAAAADPVFNMPEYRFNPYERYHSHQRAVTADAAPQMHEPVPPYEYNDDFVASPPKLAPDDEAFDYTYTPSTPPRGKARLFDEPEYFDDAGAGPSTSRAPMLPLPPVVADTSFADTFKKIDQVGLDSPEKSMRPLPKAEEAKLSNELFTDRTFPMDSKKAEGSQQYMRRGRPDRGMRRERTDGSIDGLVAPSTFRDVIRAVVATGARGDEGSAVTPMSYDRIAYSAQMYGAAGNDENVPRSRPNRAKLLGALPGSAQAQREQREAQSSSPKAVRPVLTGLTSFSQDANESHLSLADSPGPSTRPRSNSRPFLNRNFMRSLPNALTKTPPLTPSTPFGSTAARGSPFFRTASSNNNNFISLPGDEDAVELFYDADEPKTPEDALDDPSGSSQSPSQGRKSFSLPFTRRMDSRRPSVDVVWKPTETPLADPFAPSGTRYH